MSSERTTISTQSLAEAEFDVRWIVAARLSMLGLVLLGSTIVSMFWAPEVARRVESIYYPLATMFGLSAVSAWWLRKHSAGIIFTALQLSLDIMVITGIIYATGDAMSPFLVLYLPHVMATSILLSRRAALALSVMATLAYLGMLGAIQLGYIRAADGDITIQVPSGGVLLQVIGLLSAMILISFATNFLTRRLNFSRQIAEQSQRDLSRLDQEQRALINGLQDGVISVALDETIANLNQAARDLLCINEVNVVGKPLSKILKELDPQSDTRKAPGPLESRELEFTPSGAEKPVRLCYQGSPVFNETGQQTGMIFIFKDITKLHSIEEQLKMQERMAELLAQKEAPRFAARTKLNNFVGESPIMQKVFNLIERVSTSDATVLISGESGTGKELVARAIHLGSGRANSPFVPVNCGAIPENLIESELFGHKKGSFTGADADSLGLFRQADRGTIFLDEIGELPLNMQTKLLRALQEKKVRPIGGERDIPINVRVIAATNRNLKREIEAGNFREDLYYRLNVINIQLPALRERKEDIPLLVNSILRGLVKSGVTPVVPPATMQLLLNYRYPGNVRELENILERALVLGGEVILPDHLPDSIQEQESQPAPAAHQPETQIIIDETIEFPVNLDEVLASIERRYLEIALVRSRGIKKRAAELLGMNFRSFRYRLQKFGINADDDA